MLPSWNPKSMMPAGPGMPALMPPQIWNTPAFVLVIIVSRIRSSLEAIGPGLLHPAGGVPGAHWPDRTRKSPSGFPLAVFGPVTVCG